MFEKIQLTNGDLKFQRKSSDEGAITLNPKFEILKIEHPELEAREHEVLQDYFFLKKYDEILNLDLGFLYQLYQKKILEFDVEESDELEDLEEFIDSIELQEKCFFSKPLNQLREIALFIKYPDTFGEVLCQPVKGHLICRCFSVTKEQIFKLLKDNSEISLKDLNLSTKAATGCGSCMDDLKVLMEEMQKKQNPSPIEWMIDFNNNAVEQGDLNWGEFLSVQHNIIEVKLQAMTKESFERLHQETGASNISFKFKN